MRKWTMNLAVALLVATGCSSDVDVSTDDDVDASTDDMGEAGDASDDRQDSQSQDQATDTGSDDTGSDDTGSDDDDDSDFAAVALITEAAATSVGRSVRGTVMVDSSLVGAHEQSSVTQFEYDASGALSMTVSMNDDDASGDVDSTIELRDVGGTVYLRVPKDEASDRGLDMQGAQGDWMWAVVDSEMLDDMMGGIPAMALCDALQMADMGEMGEMDETSARLCHPLESMAALIQFAENVAVIGDGEIDDAPITKVGFTIPLHGSDDSGLLASALFGAGLMGMDDMGMDDMDGLAADVLLPSDPMPLGEDSGENDVDAIASVFINALEQMISEGVVAEVWVDDNKLIRRFSLDMASIFTGGFTDPDTGEMPAAHIIFDFWDFDADIMVDVPPFELVVGDLSSLNP